MYNNLELFIIIICAVSLVGIYIYLKVSGEMWYGINWHRVFYEIRRAFCKVLLKLHK